MNHGRTIFNDLDSRGLIPNRIASTESISPVQQWTSEVWLPEQFEPRYAYPLLVWLHDHGADELADAEVANAAATQNMIVMSVRGPFACGAGYGWADEAGSIDGTIVWRTVAEELAQLPPELNYHSERVFLAGRGAGAIASWRAWIRHCDQIAGAGLAAPPQTPDASTLREAAVTSDIKPTLSGRLWIGAGPTSIWRPVAQTAFTLGAEVSLDAQAETPSAIGRSIDRWVMRAMPTAVFS